MASVIKRSMPYLVFADVTFSLAEKFIKMFGDGSHRHHTLTDAEIAHLQNGGEVHLTNSNGDVICRVKN